MTGGREALTVKRRIHGAVMRTGAATTTSQGKLAHTSSPLRHGRRRSRKGPRPWPGARRSRAADLDPVSLLQAMPTNRSASNRLTCACAAPVSSDEVALLEIRGRIVHGSKTTSECRLGLLGTVPGPCSPCAKIGGLPSGAHGAPSFQSGAGRFRDRNANGDWERSGWRPWPGRPERGVFRPATEMKLNCSNQYQPRVRHQDNNVPPPFQASQMGRTPFVSATQ